MRILVIEDDLEIQNCLHDLLEVHGHTVLAATNGVDGIELAKSVPDLIFCDIAMPAKGGYEVISTIRGLPCCQDVPFVFLTARAGRADQRYGMSIGADDYITKPFSERDILDAIAARLRRQRPLREKVALLLSQQQAVADAPWSHELMTPLCGILGGLELIEAEVDAIEPSVLRKHLGLIREGAERQHALSRKLVTYYELERIKVATPPRVLRCSDTAAAVVAGATAAAVAAKRSADLILHCAQESVPLSDAYLHDAVAELVENALRFSLPGRPVSVTGVRQGARFRIEVADQGHGMSAEQRQRIEAFRQHGRSEREQQGLGLGLAIVRSAVELAGGELSLETGPGNRGLKATLDLPCS
jgi:two-component system sensor histidine kinase/response regulator